jgi:hypothetical protein
MGRRQVVRQRFLVPPFLGSNPSAPVLKTDIKISLSAYPIIGSCWMTVLEW